MHSLKSSPQHFPALDGLRGVMALLVAWFHATLSFSGYLAVDFFLILSGFILAHRYLGRPKNVRSFIAARIARLYPMQIFGLLAYALATLYVDHLWPEYPNGVLFTFIQNLTLTQNIGLNPLGLSWNIASWSVSVEFWINIIFIVFITRKTSSAWLAASSLFCFLIIFSHGQLIDVSYQNYWGLINSGLLRGWGDFSLGILSYRLWYWLSTKPVGTASLWRLELILAATSTLMIYFHKPYTHWMTLQFVAPLLFSVVVLLFALQAGPLSLFFAKLKPLGTISYSIYLNHLVVMKLMNINPFDLGEHRYWVLTTITLLLIAISTLTYHLIEKPGKRILLAWIRPETTPQ